MIPPPGCQGDFVRIHAMISRLVQHDEGNTILLQVRSVAVLPAASGGLSRVGG